MAISKQSAKSGFEKKNQANPTASASPFWDFTSVFAVVASCRKYRTLKNLLKATCNYGLNISLLFFNAVLYSRFHNMQIS